MKVRVRIAYMRKKVRPSHINIIVIICAFVTGPSFAYGDVLFQNLRRDAELAGFNAFSPHIFTQQAVFPANAYTCDTIPDWTIDEIDFQAGKPGAGAGTYQGALWFSNATGTPQIFSSNTFSLQAFETMATRTVAFGGVNIREACRQYSLGGDSRGGRESHLMFLGIWGVSGPGGHVQGLTQSNQLGALSSSTYMANSGFVAPQWTFTGEVRGTIEPSEPIVPDPVIIIPGILGSEKNSDGEWVIDPILHTYDDLIATLDVNHYTPGVDLFPFPYNWRKSNVETALLLKDKIDEVKAICGCEKVDLVAHSMGGLVARQYIQSDAYEDDVDQLIFIGTPHLGAPKAYLMWEGGEIAPVRIEQPLRSIFDELAERVLEQEAEENGYEILFEYLRSEPIESVRELLPVYDYLFDDNSLRNYPENYPANPFLEELNNNIESLLSSGIEVHNIVGATHSLTTISGINVVNPVGYLPKWEHGYPSGFYLPFGDHGMILSSGDQTVPLASAALVNSSLLILPQAHGPLVSASEGDVFEVLTGVKARTLVKENTGIDVEFLLIKMLSPADLLVVTPEGKKIGKENGQSLNEIPGAFYTGFTTDTEFITILNPLDGEYTIVTQGTGAGSYTVEVDFIGNATTTSAAYTGVATSEMLTELTLEVDVAHPEDIKFQAQDADPPAIIISRPLAKDYVHSESLPVSVSAQDASGILGLETKIGTTTISNNGTLDLFFVELGIHTITASSTDVLGNATTSSRTFRVVATATSTVADFERAYALGWMTKKVHDALVKKVRAIIVIKKSIITIVEKNSKKKVEQLEQVLDKVAAKAILRELGKYRGKGLDERAYHVLKEDIQWLLDN